MRGPLPEFVDPFRLASQQACMNGVVPVTAMTRVAALMRDGSGAVEIALRFRMSASGVPRVDGSARLTAHLVCQRCLDPFDVELAPELKFAFMQGGGGEAMEKAELAAGYEPLEYDGRVALTTIVEDEILLTLPDFPMHLPGACTAAGEIGATDPGDSPFAGLRAQLQQSRT